MSYGASNADSHRQLGLYTGRSLGGATPQSAGSAVHEDRVIRQPEDREGAQADGPAVAAAAGRRGDSVMDRPALIVARANRLDRQTI